MKRIVIVAALAALAACQQEAAPAPEATEEAAAAAPAATTLAADGKSSAGTFQVTTADGEVYTEVVNADGTYVSTNRDGKVSEKGRWVQKSPTVYCTTKDEAGAKEVCNTEAIDDKGVWTSVNPDTKKTATVVRVET